MCWREGGSEVEGTGLYTCRQTYLWNVECGSLILWAAPREKSVQAAGHFNHACEGLSRVGKYSLHFYRHVTLLIGYRPHIFLGSYVNCWRSGFQRPVGPNQPLIANRRICRGKPAAVD